MQPTDDRYAWGFIGGLAGTTLAGTNLAGTNLAGTNLAGSNLGGANLAGSNLAGTNIAGTNLVNTTLATTNVGVNIHNLSGGANGLLFSGEDLWSGRTASCVVLGVGGTAFGRLVSQNTGPQMYTALKQTNWRGCRMNLVKHF